MRIALGLKHLRQVIASAPIPSAPTLTWTSGTSVRDPVFTLTGILAGDIVQLQIDDDPAFGSTYGDDSNTVDSTEAADGQLTFPGIPTLAYATTYYARARITRAGVASAWSNSVNQTTDAAPASTLSTTTGVNKSQWIDSDGHTATGNASGVGTALMVRSTTTVSTGQKVHIESTVAALTSGGKLFFGFVDSTTALGSATTPGTPGDASGPNGFCFNAAQSSSVVGVWANAGFQGSVDLGSILAANDVVSMEYNESTKAVLCKHKRSSTVTTIWSGTLTSKIPPTATPFAGAWQTGDSQTVNFAGTAITPTAGYTGM
jgi:hypothetical protein